MSSQAEQLQQTRAFFRLDAGRGTRAPAAGNAGGKGAGGKRHNAKTLAGQTIAAAAAPDEACFTRF
jgi:hypothetical protein